MRGGLACGAGSDLPHKLSLQGSRGDGLPLFPQAFRERLEPAGHHLPAGVWVPGARAGAGLLLDPDHLGPSAVRPEQPTEPSLCEDHLQRPECLPVTFYPQSLGHPAAVPGKINS